MVQENLTICEVCEEETLCTKRKDGKYVCSECVAMAYGSDPELPIDTLFKLNERSFSMGYSRF